MTSTHFVFVPRSRSSVHGIIVSGGDAANSRLIHPRQG